MKIELNKSILLSNKLIMLVLISPLKIWNLKNVKVWYHENNQYIGRSLVSDKYFKAPSESNGATMYMVYNQNTSVA
jgi:hypothetical protein